MRVVVTGGGTGGHIFPALAVAEYLRDQGHEIFYIGKPDSMESDLVPKRGFPFSGVFFTGMPRKPGLALIKWFAQLYQAKRNAKALLQELKPDVVFGTGGYVTGPVLMAANTLHIPYAVHEPDAHPGMVNRLMAKKAKVVTAAFAASRSQFKLLPNATFKAAGNPVRQDLGKLSKTEAIAAFAPEWSADKPTLLVFGGSQGARSINQAVVNALPALLNERGFQVIHITGQKLFEETQAMLAQVSDIHAHPAYKLLPFSQEMPTLMAASDIAVCRSGSLTLSETYMAGLPTILIPYPHAAADHQTKNAQASVEAGASHLIEDKNFTAQSLLDNLQSLVASSDTLARMRQSAKAMAKPEATVDIALLLTQLAASAPVSA